MAKSKFNLAEVLGDTVSKLNTMQVREIPLDQLEENPDNSYVQTGIDELAESIEVIGLQQPLVVVPVEDGRFRILAGHRRRNALEKLERKTAPCVVLDADLDPSLRVLILHWTNTMARGGAGLTAESTFLAAKEIKEALVDLKQRGVLELPGKLRTYVADVLKVSEAAIARADAINAHLSKAWKSDYKKTSINDSVAYELSQCDDNLQRELHDLYKGKPYLLDAKKVKAHKKAAAAGFAPLKCPKEPYCIEPCVGTDKRAAAVKRGECPGCCHDCDKADGCEWVCGRVSKANRAHTEAEEMEAKRKQENEAFEASPLGKLRRHMRETLAVHGVHSNADLPGSLYGYGSWIWTNNPTATSPTGIQSMQRIADHIGIDLQQLLFGNPEGAPLRQLDEQMQQAVAELPQVNGNGHVCVTGLNPYGVCGSAQCCGQPYACCMACPEPCNIRCGYLPKPQPAPVWHPYPDERPDEGQTVLTLSRKNYNRGNYAAYVYRAGGWYLPEFSDDGLMTVDVRWWSAELPPEERMPCIPTKNDLDGENP